MDFPLFGKLSCLHNLTNYLVALSPPTFSFCSSLFSFFLFHQLTECLARVIPTALKTEPSELLRRFQRGADCTLRYSLSRNLVPDNRPSQGMEKEVNKEKGLEGPVNRVSCVCVCTYEHFFRVAGSLLAQSLGVQFIMAVSEACYLWGQEHEALAYISIEQCQCSSGLLILNFVFVISIY